MTDFFSAAKRHYSDDCYLQVDNRIPNAGQLYGFAAECGIKALLVACGHVTTSDGDLAGGGTFRKHIHKFSQMTNELQTFLQGRDGARYLALIPYINNFSDWNTDHRYFSDNMIPPSHDNWQKAAYEVMQMLENLQLDGRLP